MSGSDPDDTESSGVECPECGDSFPTERGMHSHYGQVHEGSISGKVEKVCQTCGGSFEVYPNRADTAQYCSKECLHGDTPDVECENCGAVFTVSNWRAEQGDQFFCDPSCRGEWISENLTGDDHPLHSGRVEECAACGEEHLRPPSHRDGPLQFCSQDCYGRWISENRTGEDNPQWEGGVGPYGAGWNEAKKEAVRERDGRKCQHCGLSESDHIEKHGGKHVVHHITPARKLDDPEERNAMKNLVTLCRGECHQHWEKMAPLRPAAEPRPTN